MKKVTISFTDDQLPERAAAAAAKVGRSLDDVTAEALGQWLRQQRSNARDRQNRALAALRDLEEIRLRQPPREVVEDLLAEIRAERS